MQLSSQRCMLINNDQNEWEGGGGGGENFMKLSYFSLILSYDPADFIFLFLLGEQ